MNHLTLDIEYDIRTDQHTFSGDVKPEMSGEIIGAWIRGQIGKGKDKSPPEERDVYHISIEWYPENDDLVCRSDTGNKSLREGILIDILKKISDED